MCTVAKYLFVRFSKNWKTFQDHYVYDSSKEQLYNQVDNIIETERRREVHPDSSWSSSQLILFCHRPSSRVNVVTRANFSYRDLPLLKFYPTGPHENTNIHTNFATDSSSILRCLEPSSHWRVTASLFDR